jgi:hypothetical protein
VEEYVTETKENEETKENRKQKKNKENKRAGRIPVRRILLIGGAFILGFVILGVIAITVWDYSNSVAFCANFCHDVHPEEIHAFQDSYHASIQCTECHMSRVGTIHNIVLKAGHFRHLPEVIFKNYTRPLKAETMRPVTESCELCHYPPAFHADRVREIQRFQEDEANTEKDTYLILKTGGGQREEGLGYGIHWHITNPVEYIASDEEKQDIRWVKTTLPDGRTAEYNDVTDPLSPDEIANAEKKVMDCVDCHNRVGHPFPSPEDLVDQALADGRLSKDLPYAKDEMLRLLTNQYSSHEEALAAVDQLEARYTALLPEAAAKYSAEIDQAQQLAKDLIDKLYFAAPGVTWQDFAENGKHKDFAGCFRCHDGKHLTSDGESIRLQCNICHNVPETVNAGDRPPQVPLSYIQEPASHLATNFIADHRFQASEECGVCHGEIKFGADDSSFCANSSCHGQPWPAVNLDAAFPHPIPLVGKHAQVLCSECHKGVEKPEYKCANCHNPPSEPHFGENCEECHTPEGWEQATLPPELHPVPLVGAHANLACAACHASGEKLEYKCSNCHEPPANHLSGECDTCHTPEGWAQSAAGLVAAAPQIPHGLTKLENCLGCHAAGGNIKPVPATHADYVNEQCTLCHKLKQ